MEGQKVDNVNHPAHYEQSTSIECIEMMEAVFGSVAVYQFCMCNALKYIWRHKHKNGLEDLDKAEWYLRKANELDGESVATYDFQKQQRRRLQDLIDLKRIQWQESH